MPKYYPINLLLENKRCLVIGAGKVAERKARRLLECGAIVTVVSPKIALGLKALAIKRKIIFKNRLVRLADLKGMYLIVCAATDRKINALVSSYCAKRDILVNVVDSPKECSFTLPSIVRKGDLTLTISTEGISPALSKKIRQGLEKDFGPEYAKLLRIMKGIRPQAIKKIKNSNSRKVFFQKALAPEIFNLLKRNKEKDVKKKLIRMLENA